MTAPLVYYNEIDAYAAQWLRNLIANGLLPPGDVDERSIRDVRPDDLRPYRQAHFFAGIGGWPLALRLAGWPDDRPVWTGSCPCQPYSVAGKQQGDADERDLWPVWFRLIRECRPDAIFGEQVANAIGHGWLDRSATDLESEGYAIGAAVLPACSVGAPHRRDRLWFVADAGCAGRSEVTRGAFGDEIAHGRTRRHGSEPNGDYVSDCDGESVDVANPDESVRGWRPDQQERSPERRDAADRVGGGLVVEHATGERRGKGRPEPEFRRGRNAIAGASSANDVANADASGSPQRPGQPGDAREQREAVERGGGCVAGALGYAAQQQQHGAGHVGPSGRGEHSDASAWSGAAWIVGADGKARRVGTRLRSMADDGERSGSGGPGLRAGQESAAALQEEAREIIPLIAANVPARVGKLRALGNAIVPQVAAEFIAAYLDARP